MSDMNIQKFFSEHIKLVKTVPLTNSGHNNTIFSLEITLDNGTINVFVKKPSKNEFIQKFSNIDITFQNELDFYTAILPFLRRVQNATKLSFFPKFYGGEYTKNETDVILIEDLSAAGYKLWNNVIGCDLETAQNVLRNLAEFHGASLGLKQQNEKLFTDKFTPYLKIYPIRQLFGSDLRTNDVVIGKNLEMLCEDDYCRANYDKLEPISRKCVHLLGLPKNSPQLRASHWSTIIHGDLWTNNIMVKNKEVVFIDMQTYEHASVVRDVLFFLFTSVQNDVIVDHLDHLLSFYHMELLKILGKFQIDLERFSLGDFEQELKQIGIEQSFLDVMIGLHPTLSSEELRLPDLKLFQRKDFFNNVKVSDVVKEKAWIIAKIYLRKKWY